MENTVTMKKTLDRNGKARIIQLTVTCLVFAALLFGSAGTFAYINAWLYLGFYVAMVSVMGSWMLRNNPDLINERGRMAENVKRWDKIQALISSLLMISQLVVAGLDAVRFHWTHVPTLWVMAGSALFMLSYALVGWSMMNNAYLATFVRIQDDRGHQVASGGPYRIVRHPMHLGMLLSNLGMPLMLGSLWTYIPCTLLSLVMVIRTVLEDDTLQKELPGYKEYAAQVHYRLIPKIW